jgi:hypothetical protein
LPSFSWWAQAEGCHNTWSKAEYCFTAFNFVKKNQIVVTRIVDLVVGCRFIFVALTRIVVFNNLIFGCRFILIAIARISIYCTQTPSEDFARNFALNKFILITVTQANAPPLF